MQDAGQSPGPDPSLRGCSLSGLGVPARGRMHCVPLWPQLRPAVQAFGWVMEEGSQLSEPRPVPSLQQPRGHLDPGQHVLGPEGRPGCSAVPL